MADNPVPTGFGACPSNQLTVPLIHFGVDSVIQMTSGHRGMDLAQAKGHAEGAPWLHVRV